MKKYLILLLSVVMCLVSCSGEDVIPDIPDMPAPDPVVSLTIPSTENLSPTFSSDGGSATVSFTANATWTAKVTDATVTWCTVSPASGGNGNHTITISTVSNDTPDNRAATVLLTAGTDSKAIKVTQKQKDALTVTSNKFEVSKEGGLVEIETRANIEVDYTISEEGKTWITYVGTRSMKTSYLTFKVSASDSTSKREAKIILKGGNLTEEITIEQEAGESEQFSISSTKVELEAEQSTFELTVTTNIGYEIKSEASWINEITTKAVKDNVHRFEVSTNASTEARQGVIVVCNDRQECIPVTVKQKGMQGLSVSQSEYNVGSEGETIAVNVTGKVDEVEISADWIRQDSGSDGNYKFAVSKNEGDDSRTAEITFKNSILQLEVTVKVIQKQKDALTVTSNKFELPAEGGLVEIEAKANIELSYTISEEGKSWISFVGTRAMKTSYLTFKVAESDSLAVRKAKITVSGGGLSEEITVIQEAKAPAEFKISQTEVEVGSEKSTFELVITSSIGYEVKPEADWITQTSVTGSNGVYTHTFEVAENASTDSRSGIIVVCNDEQKCIPVTVKQKGAEGLSVSQNEFNVSDEGETIEVKVTGKVDEVSIPVEWIKQESATEGLYKFAVSKNESPDSRSAEITFKNTAQNREVKVKVNQLCGGDIFSISTSLVEVNYGASTFEVTITASMGYEVKSQVDWIKEITSKAVSTNVHVFEISANSSNEAREGVIVVCNDNQECIPIVVKQKGKPVEGEEWKTKEFYHKSLAMRFTADWCGYCPNMATALAEAQKALPDKLEVLSVHASGGLQADASVSLCNNYAISGFPTGLVDGRVYVQNNNIATIVSNVSAAVKETEEKYETITGASWNSSISGNNILLDLKVYLKKAGSYKVTALLVENDIVGYQADYNNGSSNNYVHKDIVRGALSDALGDAVSITENGQIESFNYSLAIPSGCNKDNLRIVVYIQTQGANGSYYINNCASAKVGKEQQLMVKSNNSGDVEGIVPGEDIPFNN